VKEGVRRQKKILACRSLSGVYMSTVEGLKTGFGFELAKEESDEGINFGG
jgi:hypothetical protein